MKSLSKIVMALLVCVFLFSGEASAAWIVGTPYASPNWPSYGYYPAGVPVYAPPVYGGVPVYSGVPVHYYAPAPVYVGVVRPVYYAPSAVYARPRAYAVYQPAVYQPYYQGAYLGY